MNRVAKQASQVWLTDRSPLRIEYSAELLRQVHLEGSREQRGILYGRRRDTEIHLLAARCAGHPRDLRLIGLERVGVFAVRSKGDVFLSERDLEFLERNGAGVALVLAGNQGGFFLRESDNSMLTIRSRQEFSVPDYNRPEKPDSGGRSRLHMGLNLIGLAACLILSVGAALYGEPKALLTLNVHEEAGQLVAVWSPGVRGTLEIRDGGHKIQVPVSVLETRTTYQAEGGDVDVLLTTLDGITREEHAKIVGSTHPAASVLRPLVDQIARLEAERTVLRTQAEANQARLVELQRALPR